MASPASTDATEIEWQFDALDLRPVERFIAQHAARHMTPTLVATGAKRLSDVYFDTADWRIGRAGCVVRVRRVGQKFTATLKDLVEGDEGLRRRLELNEPLVGPALPRTGIGPVTRRVLALAGSHVPRPILEVRTRRRAFAMTLDDEQVGELALDETTIAVPGQRQPLRLLRVEVEVRAEAVNRLEGFVARLREECRLRPAALSKFEAGLLAAGAEIPGPVELGPSAIDEHSTLAEIAFAVLRRDAAAVFAHEPGTRLGEDPEELHQMRVATRRLRAALAMFADVLPLRAGHLLAEVGWLARELGEVRDLDVQLGQTREWRQECAAADRAGLAELSESLEASQQRARIALLAALDSRRYDRLVAALVQMLTASPSRRSARCRTLGVVGLPELVAAHQRACAKAAARARRSGVAADFHRLRIRCKRLRYALEFSADCYQGATKRFTKVLAALQGELGDMQDAEVAAEQLRAIALSGSGELSLEAVFAVGGIAERYRRESERLLLRLGREVRAVNGPEWRRLEAVLQRRRGAALAALPPLRVRPAPLPASGAAAAPLPAVVEDQGSEAVPQLELLAAPDVRPTAGS